MRLNDRFLQNSLTVLKTEEDAFALETPDDRSRYDIQFTLSFSCDCTLGSRASLVLDPPWEVVSEQVTALAVSQTC